MDKMKILKGIENLSTMRNHWINKRNPNGDSYLKPMKEVQNILEDFLIKQSKSKLMLYVEVGHLEYDIDKERIINKAKKDYNTDFVFPMAFGKRQILFEYLR